MSLLLSLRIQVLVLFIITCMGGLRSLNAKKLLKFVVFFQYIPRIFRVHPLHKEATRTSGIFTEIAWAGAAFNLFLYMLVSHVLFLTNLKNIDTDDLIYFEYLMEVASLSASLDILEKDYVDATRNKCELDERVFIYEEDSLLALGSFSGGSMNISGAKRKIDSITSPAKTITSVLSHYDLRLHLSQMVFLVLVTQSWQLLLLPQQQ